MKHPDPKRHLIVSVVKSVIRIVGYFMLALVPVDPAIRAAGFILIFSEVAGLVEEMV